MNNTIDITVTEEDGSVPPMQYEYLDHTADVQIHAWGSTLAEAFEQSVVGISGYMTEVQTIDMTDTHDIVVEGQDLYSLFYQFLDEFLFGFCAEPFFIARKVKILEFDRENNKIKARGYGETFNLDKHPQGTEVKAITYSNMQIHEKVGRSDVYVIIDI